MMDNGTGNGTLGQNVMARYIISIPTTANDIYIAFLSFSIIFGSLGNGIVLLVFFKNKARTSTDWFIIFISVMDLISSLINVPVYLTFNTGAWSKYGSDSVCRAHMFVSQSVVLAGTFLICGLALERYSKVCKSATTNISKNKARLICIAITIVNVCFSIPCVFIFKNSVIGTCSAVGVSKIWVNSYYMFVFVTFIIAFVVVVFSYSNIAITIQRSARALMKHNMTQTTNPTNSNVSNKFKRTNAVAPLPDNVNQRKFSVDFLSVPVKKETEHSQVFDAEVPGTSSSSDNHSAHAPNPPSGIFTIKVNKPSLTKESGSSRPQPSTFSTTCTTGIESRRHKKGMKTTKIAFLVCFTFVLTWLPPWIGFVLFWTAALPNNSTSMVFHTFSRMTYLVNTFMNPILYMSLNATFRKKAFDLFADICF